MKIYVATTNEGKVADLRAIAAKLDATVNGEAIELAMLPANALKPTPVESGSTFEENAWIKAFVYSKRVAGEYVMADDSGLEIDALGGAPGVHSARYAALDLASGAQEANADDEANNRRVLREMEQVPEEWRQARFVCALVLAKDGDKVASVRGIVQGVILPEPRGTGGFGYDPLFFVPELGKTFAEVSAEEKGEYSHRGRAFRELLKVLQR